MLSVKILEMLCKKKKVKSTLFYVGESWNEIWRPRHMSQREYNSVGIKDKMTKKRGYVNAFARLIVASVYILIAFTRLQSWSDRVMSNLVI